MAKATVFTRTNTSDILTVMSADGVYELNDSAIEVAIFFDGESYREHIENTLEAWVLLKKIEQVETSSDEFLELMCELDDMWD